MTANNDGGRRRRRCCIARIADNEKRRKLPRSQAAAAAATCNLQLAYKNLLFLAFRLDNCTLNGDDGEGSGTN